jgi:hypothetical protein
MLGRVKNGPLVAAALLAIATGCAPLDWPEYPADAGASGDLNVILVTLDGVRWQEFLLGNEPPPMTRSEPILAQFWSELAPQGVVYGDVLRGGSAVVSNGLNISLPAYMSILGGRVVPDCLTNICDRISHETLIDRLHAELGAGPFGVATFASWAKISRATSSVDGPIVTAGLEPYATEPEDGAFAEINGRALADKPEWGDGRKDTYTVELATRFLEKHRPRFLYLSLLDSDEWGHLEDWDAYVQSLRNYDGWLAALRRKLDAMPGYGENTVLLVTTDHGRGDWHQWGWHGPMWPASRQIWMYVQQPPGARFTLKDPLATEARHIDLRPTIELLLGLTPSTCENCGTPLVVPAP